MRIDRAVDLWAIAREVSDANVALLDNPGSPSRLGKISYLGLFPQDELRVRQGEDPSRAFTGLAELLQDRGENDEGPQFQSGLIGYLAYELLHGIEPAVAKSQAPAPIGDLAHFVRFGVILAVDAAAGCTWICGEDPSLVA
ncbi:MAG: hypothetical protein ACRDKE_06315, partial [Solirubrobacterales bacterium]